MGRQIVKQPNGLYAVWSSVVDDFVLIDATPDEIIDDAIADESERIRKHLSEIFSKIESGQRAYYQFTKGFDECVERIRELHGNDSESLKLLGINGQQNG